MIRRIHNMLHHAMKAAQQAHMIVRNPTEGTIVPKPNSNQMQVLDEEQLERFMEEIKKDPIWYEFFYTELTTGMRRGEICGLMWSDFDKKTGTLKVRRSVYTGEGGRLRVGETKTNQGNRTILLPPSTAQMLREQEKKSLTQWIFPNPVQLEIPVSPAAAYRKLKYFLQKADLPNIRFHDLRHTFATMALERGMDIKTLSAVIGHESSATTLDIYTHITDDMQREAAVSIDRGIGKNEVSEETPEQVNEQKTRMADFEPYKGNRRRAGTGCITQKSDHLWEGRYSPVWPDGTGKKRSRNVYAHTREECEEKLKVLIEEMKAEIKKIKDQQKKAKKKAAKK